jgi:hypothetical protein
LPPAVANDDPLGCERPCLAAMLRFEAQAAARGSSPTPAPSARCRQSHPGRPAGSCRRFGRPARRPGSGSTAGHRDNPPLHPLADRRLSLVGRRHDEEHFVVLQTAKLRPVALGAARHFAEYLAGAGLAKLPDLGVNTLTVRRDAGIAVKGTDWVVTVRTNTLSCSARLCLTCQHHDRRHLPLGSRQENGCAGRARNDRGHSSSRRFGLRVEIAVV